MENLYWAVGMLALFKEYYFSVHETTLYFRTLCQKGGQFIQYLDVIWDVELRCNISAILKNKPY